MAKAFREVDPRVAIASLRSLERQIASDAAPLRMLATLLMLFAGGSLLIAAIGQYVWWPSTVGGGAANSAYASRLAPPRGNSFSSVVSQSLRLTALGLVTGLALSLGVTTIMARVLYGVSPADPATFAAVFTVLTAASPLASYLPARRAANTDPMVVLRTE